MLKHGILGLISNGDKTGYEIMTVFRDSLNHFWTAQTSQIYRELQTMEKAGWIRQTHVPQTGKPDKNVFSITEAGRAELIAWLRADNLPRYERSPLLLKTFFLGELEPEEARLALSKGSMVWATVGRKRERCWLTKAKEMYIGNIPARLAGAAEYETEIYFTEE